jgi:hypothetical protein
MKVQTRNFRLFEFAGMPNELWCNRALLNSPRLLTYTRNEAECWINSRIPRNYRQAKRSRSELMIDVPSQVSTVFIYINASHPNFYVTKKGSSRCLRDVNRSRDCSFWSDSDVRIVIIFYPSPSSLRIWIRTVHDDTFTKLIHYSRPSVARNVLNFQFGLLQCS